MDCFVRLGHELKRRWRSASLDEAQFPRIARDLLKEARLHEQTNIEEITKHVLEADHLVIQPNIDYDFGTPPLAVFSDEKFLIEVLVWLDGMTGIHQHWFSGAFCVLEGSSIHTEYEFNVLQRVNSKLMMGDLVLRSANLLRQGDAQQIELGDKYIHSVFHLNRPTVSIVIRTPERTNEGPAPFSYHFPGIARVPFYQNELLKRQHQFLLLSRKLAPAEFEARLEDLLRRLDCYSTCELLLSLGGMLGLDAIESAYRQSIARHGEIVVRLQESQALTREKTAIHRQRAKVTDPEISFALALLEDVPTRAAILDLIKQQRPQLDPMGAMLGWIERFWRADVVYDWDEEAFNLLRDLLLGQDTQAAPEDIEELRTSIFRPLFT